MKEINPNLLNSCRENLPKNHPLFADLSKITSINYLYKNYIWPLKTLLLKPENSQALQIVRKVQELKNKIREINRLPETNRGTFLEIDQLQKKIEQEKNKIDLGLFEKINQIVAELEHYEYSKKVTLKKENAIKTLQKLILKNSNFNQTDFPAQTLFIPTQDFQNQFRNHTKVIFLKLEDVFQIPIDMFASAHGLHNWHGRKSGILKDSQISSQVIQNYAKMQAETMPPIFDLGCFVYPNGEVYLVSGNSHRVAAAFARGDKTIPFSGSGTIYLIESEPPKPSYQNQSLQNL